MFPLSEAKKKARRWNRHAHNVHVVDAVGVVVGDVGVVRMAPHEGGADQMCIQIEAPVERLENPLVEPGSAHSYFTRVAFLTPSIFGNSFR